MSSTILQLARRSFPPAAAAATVTAAAFLSLPVEADTTKDGNAVTKPDGKSSAWTNFITVSRTPPSLEAPNSSLPLFRLSSNISFSPFFQNAAFCEAPRAKPADGQVLSTPYKPVDPTEPITENPSSFLNSDGKEVKMGGSMWGGGADNDALYHGLFPRRQLWRPSLEYPLWDYNWDGRQPPPIVVSPSGKDGDDESGKSPGDGAKAAEAKRERYIRENGVTRHLILVRHGQYDETHKEDSKRILTPLGRKQAELTGKRLGEFIRGVNEEFGPCRVKVVRVSDLARAKETADIIYENMDLENFDGDTIHRSQPDPLLNEGRPCHHIPGGKARTSAIEKTDEHHPRIEHAFRKYFFRADPPAPADELQQDEPDAVVATSASTHTKKTLEQTKESDGNTESPLKPDPQHEFEIIVCHANVIRYFFCRALQLPPEAWLRLCIFNCSLTYFTIRPTGTVSCRMLGDIGHLPYEMNTFSMHTGFNW
mmetsp:Transcript_27488/g.56493  ORF Transcript_27488/g.56493 Transcript_27488/m.56493 type:complete len:481 (-) Transcript_27488:109-1551(-)